MRTLNVTYSLSTEQITQCATKAAGCDGGWTDVAYEYVQSVDGLVEESYYPYTSYEGTTGECRVSSLMPDAVVGVKDYFTISEDDGEEAFAAYMQSTGPASVCIDATSWNTYVGGK